MLLVKLITSQKINALGVFRFSFTVLLLSYCLPVFSQDNSPYSRYGLGDLVPSTNINSRAMGGISAAYNDIFSINFNNPASYGSFQTLRQQGAKKISSGRAILDVGFNIENRGLREPNTTNKFTASNFLVSHIMVGVPIRPNWGFTFGLRPFTRVSYNMVSNERLYDPNTQLPIDSATTLDQGEGGAYLPSIGTGFRIPIGTKQSVSFGVNMGYLFGRKDASARRAFINDTVEYNAGNFETTTTYGNLYFNGGMQYQRKLNKDLYLTLGFYGSLSQKLNATQDIVRETYIYDQSVGNLRVDSVVKFSDIKGTITYPATYGVGFVLENPGGPKEAGWLIGVDYVQNKWSDYRFYGVMDPNVRDSWQVRIGGQVRPASHPNYFSNIMYRAGFFTGPDYIELKGQKLPVFGVSLGMGLPVGNYNRLSSQQTLINLAFEYIKRGNNDNSLKENLFRLSFGLALSDFWFVKKKYD